MRWNKVHIKNMGLLQCPLPTSVKWVHHLALSSASLFVCFVGFCVRNILYNKRKNSHLRVWKKRGWYVKLFSKQVINRKKYYWWYKLSYHGLLLHVDYYVYTFFEAPFFCRFFFLSYKVLLYLNYVWLIDVDDALNMAFESRLVAYLRLILFKCIYKWILWSP